MRSFKALLTLPIAAIMLVAGPATQAGRPRIQVALLLDTSNSMDGLIEQAKSQLWTFANQFAPLRRDGEATHWADGARLGGGSYMAIDQDVVAANIPAPQDAEITRLGTDLNGTYIPVGERGKQGHANQAEQDANAAKAGAGSQSQRAVAKSSGFYRAESWDLVDAEKAGTLKLEAVDKQDLPRALQAMKAPELRAFVDAKAKERARLQARIQKLSAERESFLLAQRQELATRNPARTLDAAMGEALALQAKARGFSSQ